MFDYKKLRVAETVTLDFIGYCSPIVSDFRS